MKRNRYLLLVLILATGIFASFFGGNIPRALFYSSLVIPAVSFLYTFYVFIRFRLYQTIESRKVMKGELVPYEFTLANEDIICYTGIRVNFFSDSSYVSKAGEKTDYMLLPGDSSTMKTTLCCRYRGEYDVGVKSVVITDFLCLFSVTYPITTRLNLTVLPRVHKLTSTMKSEVDNKTTRFCFNPNSDSPDTDVRKYSPGDSMKLIHWKATARKQSLLTRRLTEIKKTDISIIIDLSPVRESPFEKIIIEDKIIESALSLANYYKDEKACVFVAYDHAGIVEEKINTPMDFEAFYQNCVHIIFNARAEVQELITNNLRRSDDTAEITVITHSLTQGLFDAVKACFSRGKEVTVVFVSDETSDEASVIIQELHNAGIIVKQIFLEDEISDFLNV